MVFLTGTHCRHTWEIMPFTSLHFKKAHIQNLNEKKKSFHLLSLCFHIFSPFNISPWNYSIGFWKHSLDVLVWHIFDIVKLYSAANICLASKSTELAGKISSVLGGISCKPSWAKHEVFCWMSWRYFDCHQVVLKLTNSMLFRLYFILCNTNINCTCFHLK